MRINLNIIRRHAADISARREEGLLKLCDLVVVGLRYINRGLQTMRCSSPTVPGAQRWEVEKVIALKSHVIDFGILNGFHPEMALLCDLCVNLRDFLCDIQCVCLRAIP